MQYIFPFGAKQPPTHLPKPLNPVIVVLSAVFVSGSIINTLSLLAGIPYILPFGARTPPYHLLPVVVNPVIEVVFAFFLEILEIDVTKVKKTMRMIRMLCFLLQLIMNHMIFDPVYYLH